MNYADFRNEVVTEVKARGFNDAFIRPVTKNNGVVLYGLVIRDEGVNISPTVYMEYYFQELENGVPFDVVVGNILKKYEEFKLEDNFDVSVFTDWNKAKERLVFKLVNAETNKKLLEEVPHIPYLDLAIVFQVEVGTTADGMGTVLVRNEHADKAWGGKTAEELYEVAKVNTPNIRGSYEESLDDIVKRHLPPELRGMGVVPETPQMTVLSNVDKTNGAGVILYPNKLQELADAQDSDLVVIPSSVHEVICMELDEENLDREYLDMLVQTVNADDLDAEDILSDHIYIYRREEGKLAVA